MIGEKNTSNSSLLVIASEDSYYLRTLIAKLCELGTPPNTVFIGSRSERILSKIASFGRIRKQLGLKEVIRRLRRTRRSSDTLGEFKALPPLSELVSRNQIAVSRFDLVNSGSLLLKIMKFENPVTVLAGCGIVDPGMIAVSKGGCLNGHPAFLPGLRGVDVVTWALAEGQAIGVTAHLVEQKVDAGKILLTRPVNFRQEETFDLFQQRVVHEQAIILAEAVAGFLQEKIEPVENNLTASSLRYAAPQRIWETAENRFRAIVGRRDEGRVHDLNDSI